MTSLALRSDLETPPACAVWIWEFPFSISLPPTHVKTLFFWNMPYSIQTHFTLLYLLCLIPGITSHAITALLNERIRKHTPGTILSFPGLLIHGLSPPTQSWIPSRLLPYKTQRPPEISSFFSFFPELHQPLVLRFINWYSLLAESSREITSQLPRVIGVDSLIPCQTYETEYQEMSTVP